MSDSSETEPMWTFMALLDSFSNWGLDEEDRAELKALADYTVNTLRVYKPKSNPVAMMIIHAFVSREEFMHGEWDTSLVHSCARLRIAAIDSFYDLLLSPGENTTDRLRRIRQMWKTAQEIDQAIEPFQEAVDKIQILSIVAGEEPFYETVQEKFENEYGPSAFDEHHDGPETELSEVLRNEVETQRALARGEETLKLEDRSNLYINPLYVYALANITEDDVELDDPDEDVDIELQQLSQKRLIAEAVARVTLDIPFPIAPLGPDASDPNLAVEGVDLDPIPMADLRSQTGRAEHYAVDRDYIERYLLTYLSQIENETLRQELGPSVKDYEPTWLDHVFVSTLKAVDELEQAGELPSDPATLRRRLAEEVHGVDMAHPDTETMADHPTHLQAIPDRASHTDTSNDYITEGGKVMPKIILEAFEQHGSFGAVIFRPTENENTHEMNFHAVIDERVDEHPDVPDNVNSYEQLWNHYFVGKELINTFWAQRNMYRERLIQSFLDEYDSAESLRTALKQIEPELSRDPATTPRSGADIEIGRSLRAAVDPDSGFQMGERFFETKRRDVLAEWNTWDLREAARALDIVYPELGTADLPEFHCPLCELVETPCGEDACAFELVDESFANQSTDLLEELFKIEARSSGNP